MILDPDICHKALSSRDPRFDGKFFVGVKSTGVYCRPVCPAPTALAKNCRFYTQAAAAELDGFRPCLRCFPESSPGRPAVGISSNTVRKALHIIEHHRDQTLQIENLAASVGVSDRHLRRVFIKHLGVSPMQLIKTRRVQLAKKLIGETPLTMSRIAMIAGFPNTRQFNTEIRNSYNKTPTELRRGTYFKDHSSLSLKLAYRPPLDWQQIENYMQLRLMDGVENFSNGTFQRVLKLGDTIGVIEVKNDPANNLLNVKIPSAFWRHIPEILSRVRTLFDLNSDSTALEKSLGKDKHLRGIVARQNGMRVLGCWSFFELTVRTIIGQQVSVAGAATVNRRLIERAGEAIPASIREANEHWPAKITTLYPSAEKILAANFDAIGMPTARTKTVKAFSQAYVDGEFNQFATESAEETMSNLTNIKGIGKWTANYVAMRALRDPDAFPAADLGLIKAYRAISHSNVSAAELLEISQQWRPWRAYAAMHLWHSLSA